MKRALSYQAFPVSLPADFTWRRGQVCGAEDRLSARLNREPSDAELAGACGLEERAVRRLRSTPTPSFVSFDSPAPDAEEGVGLSEVIPDHSFPQPDEEAARHSDYEFASRLIQTLTVSEQKVIRLRFGFEDGCNRTLDEVGRILGYGRQGIHRIESVALHKLRQQAHFSELKGQVGAQRAAKQRLPGSNKTGPTGAASRRAVKDVAQRSTARLAP
jgi:RNA polymerase primary sigma factor